MLIIDNATCTDKASELGVNNQLDLHYSAPLAFVQAFKKIPFKDRQALQSVTECPNWFTS